MDTQTETNHFSEQELNEILISFEQIETGLTKEQIEKVQNAWSQVKREKLYKKVETSN